MSRISLIATSRSYDPAAKPWMTIFTPAYNRARELPRLYDSVKALRTELPDGGRVTFEWVIIDDGSQDDTLDLVKGWCETEPDIAIRFYHEPNSGKHVAFNNGVDVAAGEVLLCIDSDDALLPEALIVFHQAWFSLPAEERKRLKGISARSRDNDTMRLTGTPLPKSPMIASAQDIRFRYHVKGDMAGFNRIEILRAYPFPTPEGAKGFMPESIVWYEIGKQYPELFIDTPVRIYYHDAGNSIMNGSGSSRSGANYYLWLYEINNLLGRYWWRSPKEMFLKPLVGITMDGFRKGMSLKTILAECNSLPKRLLVTLFSPAGFILSKR